VKGASHLYFFSSNEAYSVASKKFVIKELVACVAYALVLSNSCNMTTLKGKIGKPWMKKKETVDCQRC